MNRFHNKFLQDLAKLSEESGFVIIDGYIEPIEDWVSKGKKFEYVVEENEKGIRIVDVNQR